MNKKKLSRLIEAVIEAHGFERAREVLDAVKLLGYDMATRSGITWAIADLIIPPQKKKLIEAARGEVKKVFAQYHEGLLTNAERKARVEAVWRKVGSEVAKLAAVSLAPENPVFQIIDSGSRGSWAQATQMMGMKGLVANPKGETIELPITASYKEGLSVLEYFISTHGARKGTTDTALKTAQAGYLTRRLVDVSQDLTIKEEDCRVKEGIEVRREEGKEFGHSFAARLFSRTALEDIRGERRRVGRAGEIIDKRAADTIEKSKLESVSVRSPLTCKSLYGLCQKCYGYDLGHNQPAKLGSAVGVVAAQSIGEPGTQLTMRPFPTGGVAGADITHGLPRVEELFESRPPKGKAALAGADGIVDKIEERGNSRIIVIKISGEKVAKKSKKSKDLEYAVPRSALVFVKAGDEVKMGDQLSEGHLDLVS